MTQTKIMRLLRFKHHISLTELAQAAKVSSQRISQIELAEDSETPYQQELVSEAFAIIADTRGKDGNALRRDLRRLEYRLLDYLREDETI